jgi:hypothetical protein
VTVKQPEAVHEVQFGKLQEWLEGARSPNEQVTKARLRKVGGWSSPNSSQYWLKSFLSRFTRPSAVYSLQGLRVS